MKHFLSLMVCAGVLVSVLGTANAQFQPTTEKGIKQLETDWLFQCDNEPTFAKAKQEITWAREAADRISKMDNAPDLAPQLAKLAEIEQKFNQVAETPAAAKDFYLEVRRAKREIVMRNPLIDFTELLMVDNPYPAGKPGDATDEWGHEARHRNGFMACDGGSLIVTGLNPGDLKRNVTPELKGSFWRPDLSFDAKKVLLSYRPEGEKSFHLYEVNVDGSDLKQLTRGDYDDLDPIYTPEGKIVFCSSRQHSYVRCMPMTHAFSLSRCDGDGKNIYVISANGEPEYMANMLHDGRVIFTRWEYPTKRCGACRASGPRIRTARTPRFSGATRASGPTC